ncbi:MAG: hypothetical protein BV458_09930 [Thermoplasmata archaeon M9B2D]|nr:MAG: hypothetical protein BV458_09930 [Thermoplasmata archaeon M9B2D]
MSFTKEELEEMYKSQLVNLGEYYGLELNMRMLKEEIIDEILDSTKPVDVNEEIPASARIRRIRESNKE